MTLHHARHAFGGERHHAPPAPRDVQAWSDFWHGGQGLCLRMAGEGLKATLGIHWALFARDLRPREQVLDLGCGAGVVGKLLLVEQPDLDIHGVDSADIPPDPGKGPVIHCGVAMEALPFADASFGAAVSQFGFEYGDPRRTAPELARVLRRGATFSFLVHHRHSSIVAANAARRAALSDLLGGPLRGLFVAGGLVRLSKVLRRLAAAHQGVDVIEELARTLPVRMSPERHRRVAMWQAIEAALAPEVAILDALLRAAQSPQSLALWLAPLRAAFSEVEAAPLAKPDGAPLAWRISGVRA